MLLLLTLSAWAQQKTMTGEVRESSTQNPVIGATIVATGTQSGTTTDAQGHFSLVIPEGTQTLTISSIGFQTQTVPVGSSSTLNVLLKPGQNSLQQLVVVGYGTQKKADLTGAVATVDVAKTFGSKPLNDPTKALQGIVPGLTIQYGNGGLTTGADIKLRGIGSINGTSRPLILVDNVETDDLSTINPQDIESISVLKDAASASIYGARAAFGVILIKTKSGKRNQKMSVSYTNYFSWNAPTVLPDFANPVPELEALNNAGLRAGTSSPETFGMNLVTLRKGIMNWQQQYKGKNKGLEMVKGEDWNVEADGKAYFYKVWNKKKQFLNKYSFSQQHNINISGGTDKVSYYFSGGYSSDEGIMKLNPDGVKKYNMVASINATVTDWLDLDIKTMYRNYEYDYPHSFQSYWYYFWRWGAYYPMGTYQGDYFRSTSALLANASQSKLTDNYQRVDLGATLKLTRHLHVRADYTITRDNALRHDASSPVMAWDFWSAGPLKLNNIGSDPDQVTYSSGRLMVNSFNAYAVYQNVFAEHHDVKFTAGINAEDDENIDFYAARQGLLDPTQAELGLTYGDQLSGPTSASVPRGWSNNGHGKKAFAGYFGRINYDYKEKYLIELNGRYDGSSYFPPQDRWAFFSSASAGYRISEENFMQSLKPVLSEWKLRGSYGELGNQDVTSDGSDIYLRTMNGTGTDWVTSDGTTAQAVGQPGAVANSLRWERVSTLDFGTDMRFFSSHIGLTFDWYQRDTKGMIQSTSVPATFGTGGPKINAGNFRSKGYELTIDAQYTVGSDINLYGSIGFSDAKTVFTKWSNPNLSISTAFNYVGKTYGEIWGFQTDRYFTAADFNTDGTLKSGIPTQQSIQTGNFVYGPGDIKYKDLNGDGTINGGQMTLKDHGDLKVIGNTQPRYMYNARLGGSWKNFDIDLFLQGVGKRSWWGVGNIILPMYQSLDVLYANQLDFWTPDHQNARYPNPYPNNQGAGTIAGLSAGKNNFYPQSRYLLNLAYCRLKNLTVGYTLPNPVLGKLGIETFRVYLTGENLAEISNVGAPIDPEITDGESSSTGRTFPFMRSYAFGMQLTF